MSILDDLMPMVRQELERDPNFDFKVRGATLRDGICPECGKRKCFINPEKYSYVKCGSGNCGWSESVRKIYPHIFENLAKQFGKNSPNGVADAYMQINRGFLPAVVEGMYQQGARKINGVWAETVRVMLWDGHYWERIIDAEAVKNNDDRKAMFSWGSADSIRCNGWIPPNMSINPNDRIIITEGIFKSMAWLHCQSPKGENYKSITGLSAGNLPINVIKNNMGKKVTWILALDNDGAGHDSASKFIDLMVELKEQYLIAFPPLKGEDWDDIYRKGKLNERMLQESIWRGRVDMARTEMQKACWIYAKQRKSYFHFAFKNFLYVCKLKPILEEFRTGLDGFFDCEMLDYELFTKSVEKLETISNTVPEFLYFERDPVFGGLEYFFKIPIGKKTDSMAIEGCSLASPDAFNKALLQNTAGRRFDGGKTDLKMLSEKWFDNPNSRQYVRSLPFVGFDRATNCYVFKDWACFDGKMLKKNENDYFEAGKNSVKIKSSRNEERESETSNFVKPGKFDPKWMESYQVAFADNGLVVLAWWLGSLFAEQTRKEFGYFPIFELSGEQGTGKTQIIEFLWRCCGRREYEGFDPAKSSSVGRIRTMQKVSNLPVVFLEGDREYGKPWDYSELKMLYNGRLGSAKGIKSNGNETVEGVFRGSVLIAQNATVTTSSDAVLARIIHIHCTKEHFTPEGEKHALFINKLPVEEASGFIGHILANGKKIFNQFKKEFAQLDEAWIGRGDVQNRIVHNHAMVASWCRVLPTIFKSISNETVTRLEEYIWSRAVDRQVRCSADHPLIQLFWEQIEYIQTTKPLMENALNHSKTFGEFAVNLQEFSNCSKDHGLEPLSINELKKILPTSRKHKFIANKVVNSSKRSCSIRCYVFKL